MRNKYKLKGNTTNCLLLSYEGTKMCLSNKYYGYNIIAKEWYGKKKNFILIGTRFGDIHTYI